MRMRVIQLTLRRILLKGKDKLNKENDHPPNCPRLPSRGEGDEEGHDYDDAEDEGEGDTTEVEEDIKGQG